MLTRRLRRRPNIDTTLSQCRVRWDCTWFACWQDLHTDNYILHIYRCIIFNLQGPIFRYFASTEPIRSYRLGHDHQISLAIYYHRPNLKCFAFVYHYLNFFDFRALLSKFQDFPCLEFLNSRTPIDRENPEYSHYRPIGLSVSMGLSKEGPTHFAWYEINKIT